MDHVVVRAHFGGYEKGTHLAPEQRGGGILLQLEASRIAKHATCTLSGGKEEGCSSFVFKVNSFERANKLSSLSHMY